MSKELPFPRPKTREEALMYEKVMVEKMAEEMKKLMPGADIRVYQLDGGHWAWSMDTVEMLSFRFDPWADLPANGKDSPHA